MAHTSTQETTKVTSPQSSNWQLAKVEESSKVAWGHLKQLIGLENWVGITHKAPRPFPEENVIVCLLYGNFFVYMYKLGMALMLQLRICLATTLSSVLSNRFLNITFLLLTGLLTLTNQIPFTPYSSSVFAWSHKSYSNYFLACKKKNLFLQFEDGM